MAADVLVTDYSSIMFDYAVLDRPIVLHIPDWEEYRRIITSLAASVRTVLTALDDETRAEVDAAARRRVEPYRTEEGLVLPGVALVTTAS